MPTEGRIEDEKTKKCFYGLGFVLVLLIAMSGISIADPGADYSPQGSGNVVIMIQSGDPDLIFLRAPLRRQGH